MRSQNQPKNSERRRKNSLVKRRLRRLFIENLESRELLASDISINSAEDLTQYYDASKNSYLIGGSDTSSITIGDGIVIDTSSPNGQAGNIEIEAKRITIGNNVQILANGLVDTSTGDELDGLITLKAENVLKGFNFSGVGQVENLIRIFEDQSSSITIGASTILDGGAISLETVSGNEMVGDFWASQLHAVSKVFLEYKKKPDLFAVPVSVQVWNPQASITIGEGASLSSSAEVSLQAKAEANAFGKAVWNSISHTTGGSSIGFAFGNFFNEAKATIDVYADASLKAEEDIEISTSVDNVTELEVASIKNFGITQTDPKASSFAWGSTQVKTFSTISLEEGSVVAASNGNVTIEAEAVDENAVSTKATAYRDGFMSIGGAFSYTNATVTVDVNGTVRSGLATPALETYDAQIFNPSFVVDFETNSLVFDDPIEYTTGAKLYFDTPDGSTIPGLVPGSIYYAITNASNKNSLQLATTSENALNGIAIAFGSGYPTLLVNDLELPIVVIDSTYANAILFSYDNVAPGSTETPIFTDGMQVNFVPVAGQFLGCNDANGNLIGALKAGAYQVALIPSPQPDLFPTAIQLVDVNGLMGAAGNTVYLNTNSQFLADGIAYQIASMNLETSEISLNFAIQTPTEDAPTPLPTPPLQTPTQSVLFTNGQAIVFNNGLGNQINLIDNQIYYAIVDPATPGVIRLATSLEQAVAANPAIENAVPQLKTVLNQAGLQSITDDFTDQDAVSTFELQADNSYLLWNDAQDGTFTITINGPEGVVTTSDLSWNASVVDIQSALNALNGIIATVKQGSGTQQSPWAISMLYQFDIGTVEPGTGLVFSHNPSIADGTPVYYLGNSAKPIGGLTFDPNSLTTYYAFNAVNEYFDADIPQYVLNLRATPDSSIPVVEYQLGQSMTDSTGVEYGLLSSIASENLLSLVLPAVVTITDLDDSTLTGGVTSSQTLTSDVVTLFSFATSGTFTLTITDATGIEQTTAVSLAYNATPAAIESALNGLTGVSVVVTGLGTLTSPWSITGLVNQSLTADSSNLQSDGVQSNLIVDTLASNVQQVWTDATGGFFAIELEAGGESFTTAPIPYNATPNQVAQIISETKTVNDVPVLRAQVTGTGTASDPWQIMMWYQSIQTGDALTFNDSWLYGGMGMVNNQVYYAVVSPNQLAASGVTISLALTQADAIASSPNVINMQQYLLLTESQTGLMAGSQVGLKYIPADQGVTIRATLESNDASSMSSSTGLFPMLGFYLNTLEGKNEVEHGAWKSGVEKEIEEELAPDKSSFDPQLKKYLKVQDETNPFAVSLALALLVSNNTVEVTIGETAVIESQGSVTIGSEIEHVLHTFAAAGTARTTGSGRPERDNKAVGVALNMSFVDNVSNAIIESNAQVSGATGVSIESTIDYPFAWKQTTIADIHNGGLDGDWKAKGAAGTQLAESLISNALFANAFGVSNWLFNDSTNVDAMPGDDEQSGLDFTLSGSMIYKQVDNSNLAIIRDGAKINQSPNVLPAEGQGLELKAETNMDQVSMAGQLILGLNLGWLSYAAKSNGGLGKNYNFLLGLTDSKNTLGGSFNTSFFNNDTRAEIGGQSENITATAPTRINYGNDGLLLEATTAMQFIPLAQSGGISTGFGLEASVATIDVATQTTQAAILSATYAPIIRANEATSGEIEIKADDDSILTPSTGGLFIGEAVNIGFSSSVVVLNRDVNAFVGGSTNTAAIAESQWPGIVSLGGIVIDAGAHGKIVPVAIAGGITKRKSEEPSEAVPKVEESHFGFGVSADYSEANVDDSVLAYVNGASLTGNAQGLEIQASNDTQADLATGAASFQMEGGRDSGVGLAGAASFIDYHSTVEATLANSAVSDYEIGITANNKKDLGAFAAGLNGSSVAGTGIEVAGSVAINHVTNITNAEIANVTGEDLSGIDVKSIDQDDVVSAAGTLTVVTSLGSNSLGKDEEKTKVKIGFGFGFAQNQLDSTTNSNISDSDLEQTEGEASLTAEQSSRSFAFSAGVVFELGKGIGITPYGMVALNEYTNADVQSTVENSTILSHSEGESSGMTVASQLIPIQITVAGDLGLSVAYKTGPSATEASLGAGVSVTEVSITGNSLATIDNSNITLDSGNLEVEAFTGQAKDYANLDSLLTEINLPLGDYNIFTLAIAGGLASSLAAESALAVGIDGVGAGVGASTDITTQAVIKENSQISLNGFGGESGSLTIGALENLNIYHDAGGASASIAIATEPGVGIAVGIGAVVHKSTNEVLATLSGSTVTTAGDLELDARGESEVTAIGFGVALDVAIASTSVGVAASSATAKIVTNDTIAASIVGGSTTAGNSEEDELSVQASDQSDLYTGVGSGSLVVSVGGVSLAFGAGASVSRIDPTNTISATIGSSAASDSQITSIAAAGPVIVQATNSQELSAESIAVAATAAVGSVSVAVSTAGASSRVTTNNSVTAGVLSNTNLASTLLDSEEIAVSVLAEGKSNTNSTVGSGATAISLSGVPIGASLGVSISEVTNNDSVAALVEGAVITTAGGDVSISAVGSNVHFSKSVATSFTDGYGAAGAGGNSNIYDNAKFFASIDSGASIITGSESTEYGSLSLEAQSSESIMAQVFGGSADLGIGAVGVFISEAFRSGSTKANISNVGNFNVGDLNVSAISTPDVTSEGMSVTVAAITGSGEAHKLWIDETVATTLVDSSTTSPWNINGNLLVLANSQYDTTAKTSGAGDDQQGVNVSLLGAGGFVVRSLVTPTIDLSVSNVGLVVTGTSSFEALASLENQVESRSGSGSLVGADAAVARTENSPTISLTTSGMSLSASQASFSTGNQTRYATNANSVYATLAGGSGATAGNESTPNQSLTLGAGTVVESNGSVIISSASQILGNGDGESLKSSGFMANVGGGGLIGGFGGVSASNTTSDSSIVLADGVKITANSAGDIQIGAESNWYSTQLTHLATGSGISGVGISSTITSELNTSIEIGDGVSLSAQGGEIGIGTNIRSSTSADSQSYTFGLASWVSGISKNESTTSQNIIIGQNSTIQASKGVMITAGYNPVLQASTQNDTYAVVVSRAGGLLVIPDNTYKATIDAKTNLTVGAGTTISSDRDLQIGATPGTNDSVAYSFANTDGATGRTHVDTSGTTESSTVTIDGAVTAGNAHALSIDIDATGKLAVNGGPAQTINGPIDGTLVSVVPQAGEDFYPFQIGYAQSYDPTQLLDGLDSVVQEVLSLSLSSTPVSAVTLDGLSAYGGRVLIEAGTLSGSGSISAFSPEISVRNQSQAYLLLDTLSIPNTYGMGQIDLTGGATVPSTMGFNSSSNPGSVSVALTASGPVGNNAAGPALALLGNINNTFGTVSISNAHGALVQDGSINAQSVTIDVPNASYIVNTPSDYFGTSGSIQDYWENNVNLIPDGNFEASQWSSEPSNFLYNPSRLGWTFTGQAGISGNGSGFTSGNPGAPIGSQVAFVQKLGSISRQLSGLIPGNSYKLEFLGAQRANYGSQTQEVSINLGQTNLGTVKPTGTSYQQYSIPFVAPLPQTTPVTDTTKLQLTNNTLDTATAAWNPNLISIPSSGKLTFQFDYQASGNKAADGIAMVFQNQGPYALGQTGGALGYEGILGNTAAYQINLYNAHTVGSNFVTTNTTGSYQGTGEVFFNSGNVIQVTLVYDADAETVTESLYDTTTQETYTFLYSDINLYEVLGSTTYIGFTGAEGSATSTQTVSNFSVVNAASQTAVLSGFQGWGYVTPLSLTFTGIDSDGNDETVFLDGISLSSNPDGFTPGLNWYSPYITSPAVGAYSANVAASSVANAIYGAQSGASNSAAFSNYLYNTSGISISSFTNVNVSESNIGTYPSKANNNWNTTENGTGVMFFGSQIPYLWSSATTISGGSNFLTDYNNINDLGYLDTLSHSQIYSVFASGNDNSVGLNVSQGTGPENGYNSNNSSGGLQRGIFPVVPLNSFGTFPTSVTVSNPQSRKLGGSITAGNISVTAQYIDINGPIQVGVTNPEITLVLGAALQSMIEQYHVAFDSGSEADSKVSIDGYLGDSGVTGYYDVVTNQIVLDPLAINAGEVAAVFDGGIISTTSSGKISVQSNPNSISIVNQTNIPLELQGFAATGVVPAAIVEFQDTITSTASAYVYKASNEAVKFYQGNYGDQLSDMALVSTTEGTQATHQLASDLTYQWTQEAFISRDVAFTNANGSYTLLGSINDDQSGATVNDSWSWGPLNSSGSAPTTYAQESFPSLSSQLFLTTGRTGEANAFWFEQALFLASNPQFSVDFTYQAAGQKAADGITFAFQTQGITAVGGAGGALGYGGIAGPTAAYQINLYAPNTVGSTFVTSNSTGTYSSTGNVQFNSGNPIRVVLDFDTVARTVTETLTDTITANTYTRTREDINLTSILGSQAYIGFTGGSGGLSSVQSITDFTLSTPSNTSLISGFASGSTPTGRVVRQSTASYTQVLSAAITRSQSAKTTFADNNDDAWNYGPNSTWTWTYPTEIFMQVKNQLPANNPIAIDFSGVQYGALSVQSPASSINLSGNIQFPGSVELVGNLGITQSLGTLIQAQSLSVTSAGGTIGESSAPIVYSIPASEPIAASGDTGVYLSGNSDVTVGVVSSQSGPVVLRSGGDIYGAGTLGAPAVIGTNITLVATQGDIGSQANPLVIQSETTQIETGTVTNGLLNASALNAIYLMQPTGELRLANVATSSPLGVVSIVNAQGDITDGQIQDAYNLSGLDLKLSTIEKLVDTIKSKAGDSIQQTVDAFEGMVDASYFNYWSVLNNSTLQGGSYSLTDSGIGYFQTQANMSYGLPNLDGFAQWVAVGSEPQASQSASALNLSSAANDSATAIWNPTSIAIPSAGNFQIDFTYQVSNSDSTTLSDFDGWVTAKTGAAVQGGSLMLTDGNNNEANAFWYPEELTIPSSGRVEVNFTYTASGNRLADGVTFAFQTSGTNAIGGAGGLLGYTGISGPTAAYQINIYNGHVIGSNFVTDNSNSNYLTTAPVNLNSGNPIDVVLIFDTDSNTVTETLTETVNSTTVNTFTRTYSDVDLRSVLGAKAYVGFTGGDGGANSIQTITNFSLATSPIYGATLAFQSQGTGVVGGAAGGLGYVGITGPTAAYQISVISAPSNSPGSNFVTTNSAGSYLSTGDVDFASGNPINVTLYYDADAETLTETLVDSVTKDSFTRTYTQIDLSALFGATAFLGFTGSDGGLNDASQRISDFSMVANSSPSQVQSYVDGVYDKAVSVFEGDLVYGPNWAALPQFVTFDNSYQFVASPETADELTYGAVTVTNAAALLSLEALTPKGQQALGRNVAPVISTSVLYLSAGGSLGQFSAPLEISYSDVQAGTLTDYERTLLSQASSAGELQFVGLDANGKEVTYSFGEQPIGVTPTGVIVKVFRPLYIDVSDANLSMLEANGAINVTQTNGGLNLLYATGGTRTVYGVTGNPASVALEAEGAMTQATIPSFGSPTGNLVSNGDFEAPTWAAVPNSFLYGPTQPGWTFANGAGISGNNSGFTAGNPVAPSGSQVAFIQSSGTMSTQLSDVVPGSSYVLEFWAAQRANYGLQTQQVAISLGTLNLGTIIPTGTTYQKFSIWFNIPSTFTGPATLTFQGLDPGGFDETAFVDGLEIFLTPNGWSTNTDGILGYTASGGLWTPTAYTLDSDSPTGISSSFLSMISGGDMGSSDQPMDFTATDAVDVFALGDAWLSTDEELRIREWTIAGALDLQVVGANSTIDQFAGKRSSFSGFNSDGTGWTANAVNSSFTITESSTGTDVLTLTNYETPDGIPANYEYATVTYLKDELVDLSDKFIFGFLYQATGSKSRLALNLGNAQQPGLALVLNLGNSGGTGQWADFLNTSEIETVTSGQSLGNIDLTSNNPIQVVWTYDYFTQTVTAELTDTVTFATATITKKNIALTKLLGSESAEISWHAIGNGSSTAIHSISNFQLIDGPVNLEAGYLNLRTSGAVGTPAPANLTGFGSWVTVQPNIGSSTASSLVLTDGNANEAQAVWYPEKIAIPTQGGFVVNFNYTASGAKGADGITLAFQNQGINAIGAVGGALGYTGISAPTAAYQINIYSGHTRGSNFVTTNSTGSYLTTGNVYFYNGDTINVELIYDAKGKTITENLRDTNTNQTFTRTYSNIDLDTLLGNTAFIGFTGGAGGLSSIQTVSDFSLTYQQGALAAEPVLMLINQEIQISAGGDVIVEQVLGDLQVGSIVAGGTTEVTAPFGAVVSYVPPTANGSGPSGEAPLRGIWAQDVSVKAQSGIGSSSNRLYIISDRVVGQTVLNDILLYTEPTAGKKLTSFTSLLGPGVIDIQSLGSVAVVGPVVAEESRFTSVMPGELLELSTTGLRHRDGGPLGVSLQGFEKLQIDDSLATGARVWNLVSDGIYTDNATIHIGDVNDLKMDLGQGDDTVSLSHHAGLLSLGLRGDLGDDQLLISQEALGIKKIAFDGFDGRDTAKLELRDVPVWITDGKLESTIGRFEHLNVEQLLLDNLEKSNDLGSIPKLAIETSEFPEDRLVVIGTTGPDAVSWKAQANSLKFQALWNGTTSQQRTYSTADIGEVQLFLLGGDDFVSVLGAFPIQLTIDSGRDNDWIFVQDLPVVITDLHGDNTITTGVGNDIIRTGTGNDDIDAGDGENYIEDQGGVNVLITGHEDDEIHHSNALDKIYAGNGVNEIWLNGVLQGWHNSRIPVDVDNDDIVSPIDALKTIDRINEVGSQRLLGSADSASMYFDTDNDGFLTPLDVLGIITWINGKSNGQSEGMSDGKFVGQFVGQSNSLLPDSVPSEQSVNPEGLEKPSSDNNRHQDLDRYFALLVDLDHIDEVATRRDASAKRRRSSR